MENMAITESTAILWCGVPACKRKVDRIFGTIPKYIAWSDSRREGIS